MTARDHLRPIPSAAVYYAVMQAGLLAIVAPENVSVLWLPSGFLTAVLLLTPRNAWLRTLLWVAVVHFAADFGAGRSLGLTAGYGVANGAEVLIAASLYQWATGRGGRIDSVRAVISLPLFGVGSAASATVAALTSSAVGGDASYGAVWTAWFMSSFDSMLVVTPTMLVLFGGFSGLRWHKHALPEAGLLLILLASAVAVVFGSGGDSFLYVYLPYPIIIWSALRFRVQGAVLASVVLAVISVVFTVTGRGTMAEMLDNPTRLLWLQAYLGGAMLTGLVVAAAILERERAEVRVRQSERLYQTLADAAPVGIFSTTLAGVYRYMNAAWSSMTVTGPAGDAAKPWLEDVTEQDRGRVADLWDEAGVSDAPVGARFHLVRSGEAPRPVYGQVAAERDADGAVTGYVGSVTDLSALEESERARHLLTAAIAQSDDEIAVFTPDWRVVYLNATYERLAKTTLEDALDRDVRELEALDGIPWAQIGEAMQRQEPWRGTVALGSAQERHHEDISVASIRERDDVVSHYVMVRRDVTEEYRLAAQLQQAQKMEAVGVLAGGIAHDFNNLLTAIIASIELAREGGDDVDESLTLARDAALSASTLTSDLLTLSRRADLRTGPCDVNETVQKALQLLRRAEPSSIAVKQELAPNLPTISADSEKLTQALLNLALNACDAMPDGGELELTTKLRTPDAVELESHTHAPGGRYIEICVSDTGTGMPSEVLEKIFEPFFTTKKQGHGTGLGLAMVYACAQAHRGWVSVSSDVGQGTRFRLLIPAVLDSAVEPTTASVSAEAATILLVDDTAMVRETTQRVLESAGYSVVVAAGGRAALKLFDARPGAIDVVLTDSAMPNGDGRMLLSGLRDRGSTIPVILTSGFLDGGSAQTDGFTKFVPKPFTLKSLKTAIQEALNVSSRGVDGDGEHP